ncbi:hypothetical protein KFK09_005612 [Dendrobium nobile]|uniref:Uncharacterized protein n=1 Tax=Dendrobium nobile TaxID=94219 RepID=A0A8T3BZN2_DENNO|nr:hypothetical protein KFK09_005612 [Dendrobium nobile]
MSHFQKTCLIYLSIWLRSQQSTMPMKRLLKVIKVDHDAHGVQKLLKIFGKVEAHLVNKGKHFRNDFSIQAFSNVGEASISSNFVITCCCSETNLVMVLTS